MHFEIHGEVEVSLYDSSPVVDVLAERYAKGKLNSQELSYLMSKRVHTQRSRNMLMDRFFDRLCSVFSQADDRWQDTRWAFGIPEWQNRDFFGFANTWYDGAFLGLVPLPSGVAPTHEYVPGLIGLGFGGSGLDVAKDNKGLQSPFDHNVTAPNISYNYRNTWNSKEEGTAPILTNRDYYVLRCGAHWDNTWESRNPQTAGGLVDINEVGLFMNIFMNSRREWVVGPQIDFTNAATPGNRAHEITGITGYVDIAGNHNLMVLARADVPAPPVGATYSWNETTQLIAYTGALAAPTVSEHALITFIPRYDHSLDVLGNAVDFLEPAPNDTDLLSQLLARVVLTSPFQKTNAHTLTVTWFIYFRRVT